MNRPQPNFIRLFLLTVLMAWGFASPSFTAIIHVDTLVDDDSDNGNCTLREAFWAAASHLPLDECTPSAGPNTIILDIVGTYDFTQGQSILSGEGITIQGPTEGARDAVINLGLQNRFTAYTGSLTLKDLAIVLGVSVSAGGAIEAHGSLTLLNVELWANQAPLGGGAVEWTGDSNRRLIIEDSTIHANAVSATHAFEGGALRAEATGTAQIQIRRSTFEGNTLTSSSGTLGTGAAVHIEASEQSTVLITDTSFIDNEGTLPFNGSIFGTLRVRLFDSAELELLDSRFIGNFADVPTEAPNSQIPGAYILSLDSSQFRVDRCIFHDNRSSNSLSSQIEFYVRSTGYFSNSLVVGGDQGVKARTLESGNLTLSHLTATENDIGIELVEESDGSTSLYNSISTFNSSSDLIPGTGTAVSNLIGVDPMFVNPPGGDYRLQAGSTAVDSGDSALPGTLFHDLDHAPRLVGSETDMGAYERLGLFADDFESGDLSAWSATSL